MRYLMLALLLISCTTTPTKETFTTGDCIELFRVYQYEDQVGVDEYDENEKFYNVKFMDDGKRKVTCPKESQ